MAPDMSTVMFKVLKYADECLKADIEPTIEQARIVAGVGNLYFTQVMKEADRKELLSGIYVTDYIDSAEPQVYAGHMALTLDGAEYLQQNATMKKIASTIGDTAKSLIESAVSATFKAQMGL